MKKIYLLLTIALMFFVFSPEVSAKSYKIKIGEENLNLRDVSTNAVLGVLPSGSVHELLEIDQIGDYYKIKSSDGIVGKVHMNYSIPFIDYETGVDTATTACEIEMSEAGFESSYWPYLCFMKEQHPTWSFEPVVTGLDWTTAVSKEATCGRSLINTDIPDFIDNSCTGYYDEGFLPASKLAVAYFMDPRNSLTENFVFQFESLKYDEQMSAYYENLVKDIVGNANFYKYHLEIDNDLAKMITLAGFDSQTSPTFLGARILIELGSVDSLKSLWTPTVEGDKEYYNFYNYGVSDSCVENSSPYECGLAAAKTYGWDSLQKALSGGASKISEYYIYAGQYTTYLQKFNVKPENPSSLYVHQYQTNIVAPTSESIVVYRNYLNSDILDLPYVFYIPTYENMDKDIANTNSGGTGDETPEDPSELEIATIVTSAGYSLSQNVITQIGEEQSISVVKGKLEGVAGSGNITITDKNGNILTDGLVKTGDKITIKNVDTVKTVEVVIFGDTSGDGKITALDLLQVQQQLLGTYDITGIYNKAADTSGDSKVTALDLLEIQQHLLNTFEIKK